MVEKIKYIEKRIMVTTKHIFDIISSLNKYPIELIFVKFLIENGIESWDEFKKISENYNIEQPILVRIENYYRDIETGFYKIEKIPSLFGKKK